MTIKTDFPREVERQMGIAGPDMKTVLIVCGERVVYNVALPFDSLMLTYRQNLNSEFRYCLPDKGSTSGWPKNTRWARKWLRIENVDVEIPTIYVSEICAADPRCLNVWAMYPESQEVSTLIEKGGE